MAEDGSIATEIVTAVTNEKILSVQEDQDVIDEKKLSETEPDPNDSRSSNPDGAQSPASSTYADCEETDLPNSAGTDDILSNTKEHLTNKDNEIEVISNREKNDVNSNSLVSKKSDNDETSTFRVNDTQNMPNGILETDVELEKENRVEHDDYEDLDSEEYEIEGVSGDEYRSHDSEEENDRENGDGEEVNQEDAAQKKLDDDEDRRNPQYIPKRGFFYEHDDRTAGTGSEGEAEVPAKEAPAPEPELKRKGRRSIPDGRWQHDLYKEEDQQSKSTQELINIYGYDIRNEESAPKARRRRKYGRGPNRYTRKWDDAEAYAKQTGKALRVTRRQKPLPIKREEYDAEFPALDRQPRQRATSRERRVKSPPLLAPPKPTRNHEMARNDGESKYREERRRTPPRKFNSDYIVERSSRSFTKRIPTAAVPAAVKAYNTEASDTINDFKPMRTKFVVSNTLTSGPRGRGIAHGKPITRHINNVNEFEPPPRQMPEPRVQFLSGNRGRGKRLDRPSPNQNFFVSKSTINDDELRELTEQMAAADLRSSRNVPIKNDIERRPLANELVQEQPVPAGAAIRSKRYSYQRQRLLPDSSIEKTVIDTNLHSLSSMQSVAECAGVGNMVQSGDNNGLHQVAVSHNSVPMIPENQLTSAQPSDTSSLSVNAAASIPSSSLAVSASLIPLSAPPMTASGAALQAGAPPLPIMGFFQHPQGFTNQGTAAQIYTRDQSTIMAAPSNQPVQLVAFLPATRMLSNTNHTPSPPTAPPPPPPPPTYPTSVISYPQGSPTQQTQQSFSSETYSMPPVTLAPIHQPEMYQSRGGVTYYNTRSQVKPRSPPPPRVKTAIPIVPPPNEN